MTRLRVPVQLRWADMDAYGHVNNVQMLQLLEEARIEAFWTHSEAPDAERPTAVLDAGPGADTTTLVARQEIEYLRPLAYRRTPVVIELWVGHIGGASIDVCYQVLDGASGDSDPYARACTTVVLVDTATGRPRRISEAERAAWSPYLGEMMALRRRRPADAG